MRAPEYRATPTEPDIIRIPRDGANIYECLAVLEGGSHTKRKVATGGDYCSVQPRTWMTPSMRLAFVWAALRPWHDLTVPRLMEATGMSRATAKRAMAGLRDIVTMSVRIAGPTGRTVVHCIDDPRAFMAAGMASFGAAVIARILVDGASAEGLPLAGTSALASLTDIAAPRTEVRACGRRHLRGLTKASDGVGTEVLALSYDPTPLAEGGLVDPATLALTCAGRPGAPMGLLPAVALEEALVDTPWLLALAIPIPALVS